MTAIILQARLDSGRLPEKALLPLGEKPLISRVMEALKLVPANLRILACPEDSFSSFSGLAKKEGFEIFSGPKDDVLERFCMVIRRFKIDRIIRATGDNPFVFTDAAFAINSEAMTLNADYAGYLNLPYGAGVESVNAHSLLSASESELSSYEREHVCPYLYNHGDFFNLHRPSAPLLWQGKNIRLTVDTQEDYERAKELYNALKNEECKHYGHIIIKTYINSELS